jgi:acyl-coenzyme A synthetase/AMP-(fatty) acid ligase
VRNGAKKCAPWHPGVSATPELAVELIDYVRPKLAGFKLPRAIDFTSSIPRSEAGKVLRGQARATYWEGRARQI